MTNRYVGEPPSRPIRDGDHLTVLAVLPEYVMIRVLQQQIPTEWNAFEQHLSDCSSCRGEYEAMLQLMSASYSGTIPATPTPAPPDLVFLKQDPKPDVTPLQPTFHQHRLPPLQSPPPLALHFSPELVSRMAVRMTRRTPGIRLCYQYEHQPANNVEPAITIEVFALDDAAARAQVCVCVEFPDRGPYEQAGNRAILQIDQMNWSVHTNESGEATFHDVPLDEIERWQFIFIPPEDSDRS